MTTDSSNLSSDSVSINKIPSSQDQHQPAASIPATREVNPVTEFAVPALSSQEEQPILKIHTTSTTPPKKATAAKMSDVSRPIIRRIPTTPPPERDASIEEIRTYVNQWALENPDQNTATARTILHFLDRPPQNKTLILDDHTFALPNIFHTHFIKDHLSVLIINSEHIQQLPAAIGELNLKALSLNCKNLKEIPKEIGNMSNLESLNLNNCSELMTLPQEIYNLKNLKSIDINHCSKLESLPEKPKELEGLTSLNFLNIKGCKKLQTLPRTANMVMIKSYLNRWEKEAPPNENRQATKKVLLDFLNNPESTALAFDENTFSLPDIFNTDLLKSRIQELNIQSTHITELPKSLWELTELQCLNLTDCTNLREVPQEIGALKSLKYLELAHCRSLTKLPGQIGHLEQLVGLRLDGCTALMELPPEIGQLQKLDKLFLTNCTALRELPQAIGTLSSLRTLQLRGCIALTQLPMELWGLVELSRLNVSGCINLENIPHAISQLTHLTYLNLSKCNKLSELPNLISTICSLPLKTLLLSGLTQLERLPNTQEFNRLSTTLEGLDLSDCTRLQELPDLSAFQELEHLNFANLAQFTILPVSASNNPKIISIDLSGWSNFTALPEGIGSLPNLQQLNLNGCNIVTLPQSLYEIRPDGNGSVLVAKLPRLTAIPCASQHLKLLTNVLSQSPPPAQPFRSYIRSLDEFSEGGIDQGGISRYFWSSRIPDVAMQLADAAQDENNPPVLTRSDDGFFKVEKAMNTSMSPSESELCEDMGKFLAAALSGLTGGYKIGTVFPQHVYAALLYMYDHPIHLNASTAAAIKAYEQKLCFIIAKTKEDGKKIQTERPNEKDALFDLPENLLEHLAQVRTKESNALTDKEKQEFRRMWEIMDARFEDEELPEAFRSLNAYRSANVRTITDGDKLDAFAKKFLTCLKAHTSNAHTVEQIVLTSAYEDYRIGKNLCTPLMAVAKGFRNAPRDQVRPFLDLMRSRSPSEAASALSNAIQGPAFSREACVNLLQQATTSEDAEQVREWLVQWCDTGLFEMQANPMQMKQMLSCFTGAPVIPSGLTLKFNPIRKGLCQFHTCFNSVDPGSLLLTTPDGRQKSPAEFLEQWISDMHHAEGSGFREEV